MKELVGFRRYLDPFDGVYTVAEVMTSDGSRNVRVEFLQAAESPDVS